ncbi:MAG: cytochrome c nitrite reductase small subunit [Candidatus Zixiibacteriota bacterium]
MGWKIFSAVLMGLFFGLSGFTFHYAEGLSYLSNDPKACVNCHVMRDNFDSWQKGSHHAAATCNDCHVPHSLVSKLVTKLRNGYNHSKGFTFMDFPEPIRIKPANAMVLQKNCIGCHEKTVQDIAEHDETEEEESVLCVRCHTTVGHGGRK